MPPKHPTKAQIMTYLGWLDNAGSWLGHVTWEMAEKRGRDVAL